MTNKSIKDAFQLMWEYVVARIPTNLSQLTGDANNRTVTDTEKATWNAKSNFSGNYNDLSNKPSTETWTFTLEDGSTVTKSVVIA